VAPPYRQGMTLRLCDLACALSCAAALPAGAAVFLDSPAAHEPVRPLAGAEIAQQARQFVSAERVVTVVTAVAFPNRDKVRHRVHSFSRVERFGTKLYAGTPAAPVVFDQPGVAVLGCNIHDKMAAWVVIVDTPWYGRTDELGRWVGAQVPPGQYKLRAWHPDLPPGAPASEQALRVDAGGAQAAVKLGGGAS
jgi:plastocyanin